MDSFFFFFKKKKGNEVTKKKRINIDDKEAEYMIKIKWSDENGMNKIS